jgi:hypothetical protein
VKGWALGDRNYRSPKAEPKDAGSRVEPAGTIQGSQARERAVAAVAGGEAPPVEMVIGQLVCRYQAKKVWARDCWHLYSRILRKVLSYSLAVCFCQQAGLSPLRFSKLLTY